MKTWRLSWKCVNLFTIIGSNDEKAANLREKLLEKARVPRGEQIRKWYDEVVNLLKLKGSSIEDVQYTGPEHLIRQFNSEQINADTLISCDEEILENAPGYKHGRCRI